MNGLAKIRDSYHVRLWLTGEAVGFLDTLYPEDEPEIAIARLLDREMNRARSGNRRSLETQIHHLERLVDEKDAAIARLQTMIDELTTALNQRNIPEVPAITVPPKLVPAPNPADNPINKLQELCQQEGETLPSYSFGSSHEGFWCEVQALELTATGVGRTKKAAKSDAAIALLELLNV